jgi:hypothetical protein
LKPWACEFQDDSNAIVPDQVKDLNSKAPDLDFAYPLASRRQAPCSRMSFDFLFRFGYVMKQPANDLIIGAGIMEILDLPLEVLPGRPINKCLHPVNTVAVSEFMPNDDSLDNRPRSSEK